MCFHNSMSKKAQELAARYGKRSDIIEMAREIIEEKYHVSAFSNPEYPVITNSDEIQLFRWGLIPFWTHSLTEANEIRKMTYNAKAETVFEKPSFRHAIVSHRCIIPSTGYFEWRHEGNIKIPYYIYLKNSEIFSMAGIFEIWHNPGTGEETSTFSILTTTANTMLEYIHNTKKRMPVILPREIEQDWINPNIKKEEIESMLKPYPEDQMEAYEIEKDILKKSPFDSSIINRVA